MLGTIHYDLPAETYHVRRLGEISKSALDEISTDLERTPAHYRAWVDGVEKAPTPALRFGKHLHMGVLEPVLFDKTYTVMPDFGDCRYKENKAAKGAWMADHAGMTFVEGDEFDKLRGMRDAILAHPAASRLLVGGVAEVTLRWVDEETGLPGKSRADYWIKSMRVAVDLKSTECASPKRFSKDVYGYRYHVQDALYRAAFDACGETIEHFAIIACEKEPPYAVAVYTLDEVAITKGYDAARRDITTLSECVASNRFPSYSDGVETLSLPPWAA